MKIRLVSLALLGALHGNSIAQNALEPCLQRLADAYHAGVNKTINDVVVRPSTLQLTTIPSFQPESGLRLVGTELYFVEFPSSYWGDSFVVDRHGSGRMDFTKPRIVTKTRHAPLSATNARRVEQIYAKAISKAKKSGQIGLDGVTYYFSTSSGACASTWSPEPRTRTGRLVELVSRLAKHTAFSAAIDLQRSEAAIAKLLQSMESD
jgi:hypothetical protein